MHLVHPGSSALQGPRTISQTVDNRGRPEELAAESIGVVLTGDADPGQVHRAGVAYRDDVQAGAVHAAMARQSLSNYQLVPEIRATVRSLEHDGILGTASTPLIYDLGSSGLTVSVVDRASGDVLETLRTDVVGGDLFDRMVRDKQVSGGRLRAPTTEAQARALDAQCRGAKEQLSSRGAVCVPGDSGLLLLSRDVFESLVTVPVESSARLVREVIARAPRLPDVVVLVGGGAHVPVVRSVIESWIALPVVVPESPELVAAQGAALLVGAQGPTQSPAAEPVGNGPDSEPDWSALLAESEPERSSDPRKRNTVAVIGSLAVLGVLGIGVAVGMSMIPKTTTGEAVPADPTGPPVTTTTAPPPPPPPPSAEPAPVRTQQPQPAQIEEPTAPPPPPPPELTIPGLPPITLPPPIQLPEIPRFPR